MIKKRIMKLHIMEDELQEAMNAVDDFINAIPKSDLRQMFRFCLHRRYDMEKSGNKYE